jgi:hypothetical protein
MSGAHLDTWLALAAFLDIAACVFVGWVAAARRRSPHAWFLIAVLMTPLLGLIALAVLGRPARRAP